MVGVGKGLLGDLPCLRGEGGSVLASAGKAACRYAPSCRPNTSSTPARQQQDNSICMYTVSHNSARFLDGPGNGNMFFFLGGGGGGGKAVNCLIRFRTAYADKSSLVS